MSGASYVEQRVKLSDHFADQTTHSKETEEMKNPAAEQAAASQTISATAPHTNAAASHKKEDVRVAVVGNVDSGKSTLIGVLTGGTLDNGRGLARSRVFMHKHENDSGRTSCISQHIMGYAVVDQANNQTTEATVPAHDDEKAPSEAHQTIKPVYNPASASASSLAKTKGWNQVVNQSNKVITFIDLAGHESYLKTTIAGLTGAYPDVAMIVVNSLQGLSKMSKEHLGIVLALNLPLVVVVTKVDMAPQNVLVDTKNTLFKVLKSPAANKMPIQIKSSNDVQFVLSNQSDDQSRIAPVFFVSCVTGLHIPLVHEYLAGLNVEERRMKRFQAINQSIKPEKSLTESNDHHTNHEGNGGGCEFMIDETFLVTGVGVVVSGTVQRGTFHANSTLLLGPASDGSFKPVFVRSLHLKRSNVDSVGVGDSCAASLRAVGRREHLTRTSIRRGMCLVDPALEPQACSTFEASIHILHHPTTIKIGYQAVIHAGMVRQAATLVKLTTEKKTKASTDVAGDCLRTGDRAIGRFRFVLRPELLHAGTTFIFREGSTKGIGQIVRTTWTKEEMASMIEEEEEARKATLYRKSKKHDIEIDHVEAEESTEPSTDTNADPNAVTATNAFAYHTHAHPRPHAHAHSKPRSHAHGKPTTNQQVGAASLSDMLAQAAASDKREKQPH